MTMASERQTKIPSIHTQAAIAMMVIQFLHKVVHEMHYAPRIAEMLNLPIHYGTTVFAIGYLIAIVLTLAKNRWGLVLGMIWGVEMIIQPIVMHAILAIPKDPIYYPVFSFTQGVLLTYFSHLAHRHKMH